MQKEQDNKIKKFFYNLKMFSIIFIPPIGIVVILWGGLIYIGIHENTAKISLEPQIFEIESVMKHKMLRSGIAHYSIGYKTTDNQIVDYDLFYAVKLGTAALIVDDEIKVIADVPNGQPMWVKINWAKAPWGKIIRTTGTEIHIHSGKDINGAGWNHDKFGSGQTSTIDDQ